VCEGMLIVKRREMPVGPGSCRRLRETSVPRCRAAMRLSRRHLEPARAGSKDGKTLRRLAGAIACSVGCPPSTLGLRAAWSVSAAWGCYAVVVDAGPRLL
jgi:hypothetical protein